MSIIDTIIDWNSKGVKETSSIFKGETSNISVKLINDKLIITNNNTTVQRSRDWANLIKLNNIEYPKGFKDFMFVNVDFRDLPEGNPINSLNKVAIHIKPVEFTLDVPYVADNVVFRLVPGHTRYGISSNGIPVKVFYNKEDSSVDFKFISVSTRNEYSIVNISSPLNDGYTTAKIHRFVGLAWLYCVTNDFMVNYLINHKDGNKSNNAYTNLEWCSYTENNNHAFREGLRIDNEIVIVYDCQLKTTKDFYSQAEAANFMGINPRTLSKLLIMKSTKAIDGRYKFKRKSSDLEITFDVNQKDEYNGVNSPYTFTVNLPDGKVETIYSKQALQDRFSIKGGYDLNKVIALVHKNNPGVKVTTQGEYNIKEVQAYHLATDKVFTGKSVSHLYNLTGVNPLVITTIINSDANRESGGYIFRYKSDDEWNLGNVVLAENKPKVLIVTNMITKEVTKFQSSRKAEEALKMGRKKILYCANHNEIYNGYKFALEDQ